MKSIMIVDDEPDNITTVRTVLEANKYNVTSAVNGDDCLAKLKSGDKPDLILMDIMMPGTPVSKIIPKLGKIKVAYLSVVRVSEAEKEDLMKSKNIVGFIQKPYDINELLARVKNIIGKP